jgi:glycosyltransferase involved in cell wall biosynthesis
MNLIVTSSNRFSCTPEGTVWTQTEAPYSFWVRYLTIFNHVNVVARVRQVSTIPQDWERADGEGVSFMPVPYYLGPWQYLLRAPQVQRAARKAIGPSDAVILRVGSQMATIIEPLLRRTGHPYGVEVVNDPYDVFAPGSFKHLLRPLFRWRAPRQLKHQCVNACGAAYVTEHALQRRYPPALGAFSTHYSSIDLTEADLVLVSRSTRPEQRTFTLIMVGTLAQLYKAPDVLIDSIGVCVREGLSLKLVLVGDGKHRSELMVRARTLGLEKLVCFKSALTSRNALQAELNQADLFVLPSHQEGLPRAMIEAMARALPCIGSTVGGIPELLPPEDTVPPGDVAALARKIREVVTDPKRMARMSARNLETARKYRKEVLIERRIAFYSHVKERTEAWLEAQE